MLSGHPPSITRRRATPLELPGYDILALSISVEFRTDISVLQLIDFSYVG